MTSQGGFWQEDNAPLPRVVIGTSIIGGKTLYMEMIYRRIKVNSSKEMITNVASRRNTRRQNDLLPFLKNIYSEQE